ncbi:hypothetical protein M8A51_20800 [Schlegelella sp. S2-27]|uniref:Secreted protein n=1 Tax=Caldimonas mangrovi TaxID=2944811 RepID=A0ABT0YU85_9BURK|nr:hypothetical protein [Caldimonas mangrovi]MCM5681974.1 hypothetical protein [Caldimonas mangrovi]
MPFAAVRDTLALLHWVGRVLVPLARRRRSPLHRHLATGPSILQHRPRTGLQRHADFQDTQPRIHPLPPHHIGREGPLGLG